ncbi:MAG: hypothetical protein Q4C13_04990, partial [Clostridia bacterium]|nr:hypothetical protein [Clostridia bacterium]
MKGFRTQSKNRGFSAAATIGFLLFAVALVAGCVWIVGRMLSRQEVSLPPEGPLATESSPPPETGKPAPEPDAESAASGTPGAPDAPTPSPEGQAFQEASEAPPTPTPMPAFRALSFDEGGMDLALVGFDAAGRADVVCVLALRAQGCTLLS